MKAYSDRDLRGIYGLLNDPRYNAVCLRITTELPVRPEAITIEHQQQMGEPGALREPDAKLGRHPE
jgi:hypothetical protein